MKKIVKVVGMAFAIIIAAVLICAGLFQGVAIVVMSWFHLNKLAYAATTINWDNILAGAFWFYCKLFFVWVIFSFTKFWIVDVRKFETEKATKKERLFRYLYYTGISILAALIIDGLANKNDKEILFDYEFQITLIVYILPAILFGVNKAFYEDDKRIDEINRKIHEAKYLK